MLDPTDAARFMKQFYERFIDNGINALVFMQYTPNIPEFLELAGESAEGLIWTASVAAIGPDVEAYRQRWVAKYKDEPKSIYSYTTRDAFDMWVQAVEKVGCVDCYDKIIQFLRAIEFQGNGGLYKFNPTDQQALFGDNLIPSLWYQIRGGKNLVTWPLAYKEADYQLPSWIKP